MPLELPVKGFTKAERAWLAKLIKEINTVRAIAGRHTTVSNHPEGQVINATDCDPCPPR
jgi:hypothetical protein